MPRRRMKRNFFSNGDWVLVKSPSHTRGKVNVNTDLYNAKYYVMVYALMKFKKYL